jgi:hypothetical protein
MSPGHSLIVTNVSLLSIEHIIYQLNIDFEKPRGLKPHVPFKMARLNVQIFHNEFLTHTPQRTLSAWKKALHKKLKNRWPDDSLHDSSLPF